MGMSSRERMLAAIESRQPDYVPCCFMIFAALRGQCDNHFEFVARQLELGLDATVQLQALPEHDTGAPPEHRDLPGLGIRYHPDVTVRQWKERMVDGQMVLHKQYQTPAGTLETAVQQTEDWPYGDHVPLMDDYLIPRSVTRLVSSERDLEALAYLLQPPCEEELARFRQWADQARAFARSRGLLVSAGWGAVGDVACWLCGIEELIFMAVERSELLAALLEMIHEWNRERMAPMLEAGVDLFIRRGWYEGAHFWSPALYRRFILPGLREDAEMAHQAGARFGYIMTTGSMALLEMIMEAGVDVLIGVDPVQSADTDMAEMKRRAAGRMALWGGVNGFLTVELGTEMEVRAAVREAMELLAPGGGFILSPVDNIRADSPAVWRNVHALIDKWQRLRSAA